MNLNGKIRQLINDPILRHWLIGRLLGKYKMPENFKSHVPPYWSNSKNNQEHSQSYRMSNIPVIEKILPDTEIHISLPGFTTKILPERAGELFDMAFDDHETMLGAHRFAWLPLAQEVVDPNWVATIWSEWTDRYGEPDNSWAWHPYTTAERAINIITYSETNGLPASWQDMAATLNLHGKSIIENLEYYGENNTSNHLSNNGRGLYFLGLFLENETYAETGIQILLNEAERIFLPSGILREGSSHYHLLLTKNYISAWIAAKRYNRPESGKLKMIARRALAVIPRLVLTGGLPLVGDISPDCPPSHLSFLAAGGGHWLNSLDKENRDSFFKLRESCRPVNQDILRSDGWLRFDFEGWSGLWHADPSGWSHMPGHGHQDCGGLELHFKDTPLFVDPGRGSYGETGVPAWERSAYNQSTLIIDGQDPYPPNKPYYSRLFREKICGGSPVFFVGGDFIELSYDGYTRLTGLGRVTTKWHFTESTLVLEDSILGKGRHKVERFFYTPFTLERHGASIRMELGNQKYLATSSDGFFEIDQSVRWTEYGKSSPVSLMRFTSYSHLPKKYIIEVQRIS